MNADKKLSRGQFLAAIGGMAVTAVLVKAAAAQQTFSTIVKGERKSTLSTYGNSIYGGRRA